MIRRGRVCCVNDVIIWDGLKDLMYEMNEERYVIIEIRPDECIYGSGLDIIC